MNSPEYKCAIDYVLARLTTELPPTTYYHSLAHTQDEVVPAMQQYASMEGITGEKLLLLQTAAYFHDIGFIKQRQDHELISIKIAEEVLPLYGYSSEQIQIIRSMILATRLPQNPQTLEESILADADLDVLGREDYMTRNQALREELAAAGRIVSDEEWYSSQLKFIQSHRYFTRAARTLRDARQQQNASIMSDLLAQAQSQLPRVEPGQ